MSSVTILHNPRCSKSRETLNLLEDKGVSPTVVEYLKSPLNELALREVFDKLQLNSVVEMMRTKEKEYKEAGLDDDATTDNDRFAAMVVTPKLMERPIVINGDKAVIGRPPEKVLDIL